MGASSAMLLLLVVMVVVAAAAVAAGWPASARTPRVDPAGPRQRPRPRSVAVQAAVVATAGEAVAPPGESGAGGPLLLGRRRPRDPLLRQQREYEQLRGTFSRRMILAYFKRKPLTVAGRFGKVARTLATARKTWESLEGLEYEAREPRRAAMRDALASLGPVAVKIGQTLSQRPDLVGEEAALALRDLQTRNVAFPDEVAWAVIRDELDWWDGPLAGAGPGEALFRELSSAPVAVASLGQVYKAKLHDGREVAVKVQRPDATRICAADYACFALAWGAIELRWKVQSGGAFENDIGEVVDRVAAGIWEELDYYKEARNAVEFEESLAFLGFIGVPVPVPELSRSRVLTTEWVHGRHLEALTRGEGLKLTRMAVEACTASLVLTGFVHADPHEGNLMLHDDGRLIFLDFGLISRVDDSVMESFATGIRACLAEDYETLAKCFVDVGFVTSPILWRPSKEASYELLPDALPKFTAELRAAMNSVDGGSSRFGALAEVLNQVLSPNWKMFTPPYVLLLIRTFLTLEGIAAHVDPNFNIYEISAPWAIRRSLSPSSEEGVRALRAGLFEDGTTFRANWGQFLALVHEYAPPEKNENEQHVALLDLDASPSSTDSPAASSESVDLEELLGALLGAPQGAALRKALSDLDSPDLVRRLASRDGKPVRRAAANALSNMWIARPKKRHARPAIIRHGHHLRHHHASPPSVVGVGKGLPATTTTAASASSSSSSSSSGARPTTAVALELRQRQARWKTRVTSVLLQRHLRRLLGANSRRLATLASLAYFSASVVLRALRQSAVAIFKRRFFKRHRKPTKWPPPQNDPQVASTSSTSSGRPATVAGANGRTPPMDVSPA